MKLFWSVGSQPGRAVKTLIDIGRLPCELVRVNVLKREHQSTDFLRVYPAGKIPVLVDNDFVLGESSAIMLYLCQKYSQLWQYQGRSLQERARVNQYISYYQSTFREALFRPFRKYLAYAYSGIVFYREDKDELWRNMLQTLELFERIMKDKNEAFITGQRITIPDFLYYYELTNLQYFGMNLKDYVWLEKWRKRVEELQEVININKQWQTVVLERAKIFSTIELPSRGP